MDIDIEQLKSDKLYYNVWKTLLAEIFIEEHNKMKKAKEYVNKINMQKVACLSAEKFLNLLIK